MRICEILRLWRKMADLGIREAAQEMGISPATLSRVERGGDVDGKTLAKILMWQLGRR